MDLELDLLSEAKEAKGGCLSARISINSLSSQPVDQKLLHADLADRFSDEEEDFGSSQDDEGEGSDSEPMLDEAGRRVRKPRVKIPANARVSHSVLIQRRCYVIDYWKVLETTTSH